MDLKEQLKMYEAALDSSTKGPKSSTPYNAPNTGMKWSMPDAFKTPLSRFDSNFVFPNSYVNFCFLRASSIDKFAF